jgi:alpha/beta superfamily hydrolase
MSPNRPNPDAPAFPTESAEVRLRGPVGVLELACDVPEADVARAGTAVICHPHPEHGGTMHNKVVTIIERSLRELGLATVRFNFRGVGASEGSYDEGNGESDDLAAVVEWARRQRPGTALWLAGFSFGAYVALRCAARLEADQLILVAPPVGRWSFDGIEPPACPTLIVQGEADEVVDAPAVFAWAEMLDPEPAVVRMEETGHFFHRRLMDLRGALKNALRNHLPAREA